jgi:hypothetical protein
VAAPTNEYNKRVEPRARIAFAFELLVGSGARARLNINNGENGGKDIDFSLKLIGTLIKAR